MVRRRRLDAAAPQILSARYPGNWEARWFDRGDPDFPAFHAGALTFGLNICTELWALETYGAYAVRGVQVILSPRATAAEQRPSGWR